MERLLDMITLSSLLLMVVVLVAVRRAHIRVEYSVSWLAGAAVLFALSLAHQTLESVAAFLGIPALPGIPVVMGICGLFVLMFFRFSVIVSRLRDDNIALAQRLAILEYHLAALQEPGAAESHGS